MPNSNSLSGANYLPQQTQQAPTQERGALGGWAGIIGTGLATIAGVASDNPYMVGFGGAAAKSYHDSYDNMNKSLIEEQRANRLADSAMLRQMNMQRYQRDLTSEDRELAQSNYEKEYGLKEQEYGLREQQEQRLGEQSQMDMQIKQKELDELNKTPEQRAKEATAVAKIIKKAELEVQADQAAAANKAQVDNLVDSLTELGVSDETIAEAVVSVRLKQAGIEMSKTKPTPFSGEQKVKLQQQAKEEYKETDAYTLEPDRAEADKAADAHGIRVATAIEDMMLRANATGGTDIASKVMREVKAGKTTGGKTDLERAISMFYQGQVTPQQLLSGATTKEEKAAVQQAITLMNREDAASQGPPAPEAAAGALSGSLGQQQQREQQAEIQQRFDTAEEPLAQRAAINTAQAQGIDIDTGRETGTFTPEQQRTIDRQVANYQKADTARKKKIIDNLRKNAPPELLKEVLRKVQ